MRAMRGQRRFQFDMAMAPSFLARQFVPACKMPMIYAELPEDGDMPPFIIDDAVHLAPRAQR